MDCKHRWTQLDRLAAENIFGLPEAIYSELVERLREATQDQDPAALRVLASQLADITRMASSLAAPQARAAARRQTTIAAAAEAFALGQLGFAYSLASNLSDKRADAEFEATLKSSTYAPYIRALCEQDMSGTELAERLGQRVETISRNLKVLRSIGAVDYRRAKTSLINFLTPAARHVAEQGEEARVRTRLSAPVQQWAKAEARDMPEIMREAQTFARDPASTVSLQDLAIADI